MKPNFQAFQQSKESHTLHKSSEVHFSRKIYRGFFFVPLIFQWKQLRKFTSDLLVNLVQGGQFSESKKHAWSLFSSWKCNHCAASLFLVKEPVLESFMQRKFEQGEISGQTLTFSESPPSKKGWGGEERKRGGFSNQMRRGTMVRDALGKKDTLW